MPVMRAATMVPPSLPAMATRDEGGAGDPAGEPVESSRPICVRRPVKAKNSGSSSTEAKVSSRCRR